MNIERTHLNITKAIYDKPTANLILNSEELKAFPSKFWNEMRKMRWVKDNSSLQLCTCGFQYLLDLQMQKPSGKFAKESGV